MIDSHSHTMYSKHAEGTVDDLVCAAISAGIEVLTITDHAPFPVDSDNRLLETELDRYFEDIEQARQNFRGRIQILSGLEFDYMPGTDEYNRNLQSRYDIDFAIGSIHYVRLSTGELVRVWDLPRLADPDFVDHYFDNMEGLLSCGLFDAVGHADTLLRGVQANVVDQRFERLLPLFREYDISFELNASGLRKSSFDPCSGAKIAGLWSYPSLGLLPKLISHHTSFTIGADAHTPRDVGAGIQEMLNVLQPAGLHTVSYYERRRRVDVPVNRLRPDASTRKPIA
ncbi:histidinol-phosphatase [Marinobacter maritimus]|uniref:histidinol-phosphatase n=1 Tax=Marinobacter maritimus TaxID=277961 RepID=UPI0011A4CE86|nr:histidinol-phosphatase [Marinobacter maritimus]